MTPPAHLLARAIRSCHPMTPLGKVPLKGLVWQVRWCLWHWSKPGVLLTPEVRHWLAVRYS